MIYLCLGLYHRPHEEAREQIQCGEVRQLQQGGLPLAYQSMRASSSLIVSLGATRFVTVALTVFHKVKSYTWLLEIQKFHITPSVQLSGLSSDTKTCQPLPGLCSPGIVYLQLSNKSRGNKKMSVPNEKLFFCFSVEKG